MHITYVMSDIHGNYEKYKAALRAINFRDCDTLFVLGDIVDRGEKPIEILRDMMHKANMIPLLGNHEYTAFQALRFHAQELTKDAMQEFESSAFTESQLWLQDGGQTTLDGFLALSKEERGDVLDYIENFSLYAEVCAGGTDYVLVHAGLDHFRRARPLESYTPRELVFAETDYDKVYFKDKILVTGHTPTSFITGDRHFERIVQMNNHIAIDCGCGFGGALGIFCLDNKKEFYV